MHKFKVRENFRYFTNRLGFEPEPRTRARLEKLLLEEEDRLGADIELLGEVAKTIANFEALIETQSRFVALVETRGQYVASARAILDGLRRSKDLCEQYQERIVACAKDHY